MERVQIPKSTRQHVEKGTWKLVKLDGVPAIWIACPGCGQHALLEHGVSLSGEVNPSLLCECGYHEWVQLTGYKGPEIKG